jgi:SAM-dependent methyltransferase
MTIDRATAEHENRLHWNEIAPVHLRSYQIEDLLNGKSRIGEIQKRELYPIRGKELIHLQCHIGTDTLSLALDGAKVTGVDFSGDSIVIARDLAQKMRLDASFLEANVLDLKRVVTKKFDIVYTSIGVLCWIGDINRWAETISDLLKEDGIFYIMELHPAFMMFDETDKQDLRIKYPYFHQPDPIHFNDEAPDYSDESYIPKNKTYEWIWSLADILTALIDHGLRIEFFHEFDRLPFKAMPGMSQSPDGLWDLDKYPKMIPLAFSLKASKRR